MTQKPKLSIIAPAYNEHENLLPLIEAFDSLRKKVSYELELIIVDDGSSDNTGKRARTLSRRFGFVKVVSYSGNKGKTYAVFQGTEISSGEYIVIFDADLQFDPEDIPDMVAKLDRGADLVAGYKVGKYQKPIISGVYNLLGKMLFHVPVRDMNALKAMTRQVLEEIPFPPDWHRYIVAWAYKNGFKIVEHPVKLRPRLRGKSKYRGIGRIFVGFFDMLSVWFQLKFARRPMLFFGTAGLMSLGMAFVIGIIAIVLRFGFNAGYRPLLTLIAMLVNIGLLLIIGGFLGEMIEGLEERLKRVENIRRVRKDKQFHKQDDYRKDSKYQDRHKSRPPQRPSDRRPDKPYRSDKRKRTNSGKSSGSSSESRHKASQMNEVEAGNKTGGESRTSDAAVVSAPSNIPQTEAGDSIDKKTEAQTPDISWGRKRRKSNRR